MTLKIRKAMRIDSAAIARVHVETWRTTYAGLVPDQYLMELTPQIETARWQRRIGQAGSRNVTLVAELPSLGALKPGGKEVVGFVSGGPARTRSAPARAEIYALYVHEDHQDQGIGRALLTAVLRDFLARGYRDAFLWVLAGNPSRFFYQAMGGQLAGRQSEAFAGAQLEEEAYLWPDLISWLAEEASDSSGSA